MYVTPKGTGNVILGSLSDTNVTIPAGKTLDVSAGTLTLLDDQISGDKINSGTIDATTITTLTASTIDAVSTLTIGATSQTGLTMGRTGVLTTIKGSRVKFEGPASTYIVTNNISITPPTGSVVGSWDGSTSGGFIATSYDDDDTYGALNAYHYGAPGAYDRICLASHGGAVVVGGTTQHASDKLSVNGPLYASGVFETAATVTATNVCTNRFAANISNGGDGTFAYTAVYATGVTVSSFSRSSAGLYALVLSANFATIWPTAYVVHATSKSQGIWASASVTDATCTIVLSDTDGVVADSAFFLTIEGK